MTTDTKALLAAWRRDEEAPREGWNFDHIADRFHESATPWDYEALCREAIASSTRLLDLGTGGGEFLLTFADVLPADTSAAEGWLPNLPVATRALQPHGIDVLFYDPFDVDPMPWDDGRFDLVVNRHGAFVADEVARVLAPGGTFLTKQIGGDDYVEAHEIFGAPVLYPEHRLANKVPELAAAGLRVEVAEEWHGPARFDDIGALVYYFRMQPWDVPDDFSVDTYADTLLELHERGPARGEPVVFTESRFLLRAVKPEA